MKRAVFMIAALAAATAVQAQQDNVTRSCEAQAVSAGLQGEARVKSVEQCVQLSRAQARGKQADRNRAAAAQAQQRQRAAAAQKKQRAAAAQAQKQRAAAGASKAPAATQEPQQNSTGGG